MEEIVKVCSLQKTFTLSKKQQKIARTTDSKKVAVNGLSFGANKGEIFGLLGPNGAGKTTTLRMLATLMRPDSGDAFIEGISVVNEPEKIRSEIGFLSADLKLEDYFTPNYLFDFFAKLHFMDPDKTAKRKKKLFEKFGIDQFAEVKYGSLSTGMKQKVSLAISIAHDPNVVIFDEPTNGLDIIAAKAVKDFLLELREQGKSIILSTHIFSLVEQLCDRVGIIIDGKMVLEGSLAELTAEKNLEAVFFDIYAVTTGKGDQE